MQNKHTVSPINKTLPALVAALSMTIFIGLTVLAFGLNALFNKNASAAQTTDQPDFQVAADQVTIQDLQETISQYQERENQYLSELQQAADQIDEISQQNLQYKQLTQALQNAGVIQVTQDGQVLVSRSASVDSSFRDDDD